MKNCQGIPTGRLILGGEVMVPRDNSMLAFSTGLLNYIIAFATQGKSGHYKIFGVATNLENMENLENSGNLKNSQNLRENSGKFEFYRKILETQGKCRIYGMIADENVFQRFILSGIPQGKV